MRSRFPTASFLLVANLYLVEGSRAQQLDTPYRLIAYDPSMVGAIVFGALYTLCGACSLMYTWRYRDWRWAGIAFIGPFCAAFGWFFRMMIRQDPYSMGKFIVMQLFVVLSPALFLAFDYIIYGHVIIVLDGHSNGNQNKHPFNLLTPQGSSGSASKVSTKSHYSFIPPRLVGTVFVTSDVITFLIQAGAGGLQATGGSMVSTGDTLFLVGVSAQGLFYALYLILVLYAHWQLSKEESNTFGVRRLFSSHPTVRFLVCVYLSSIFILVRSVFRVFEMAEGYTGKLYRTEIYLLLLHALPLVLCLLPWTMFWPGQLIRQTEAFKFAPGIWLSDTHNMKGINFPSQSEAGDANHALESGRPR